jgi:hypothetical protein
VPYMLWHGPQFSRSHSFNRLLRHARGCWRPILTRIVMGPHSAPSYDTQWILTEDLFLPGSIWAPIHSPFTKRKGMLIEDLFEPGSLPGGEDIWLRNFPIDVYFRSLSWLSFFYWKNLKFHHLSTGCCSLMVVLSLCKREVVSSSPARASRVKPKTFKIGSDCSFAKSTAFRR